jgi:replicative DNA helicase
LGLMTGFNPNLIRSGMISDLEEEALMYTISELTSKAPVELVSGDFSKDMGSIASLIDEHDPDIIVIDAIYLMTPSGVAHGYIKKWEALTEVIRESKKLMLRTNKPMIATVQFNRNQGTTSKKAMDLSDIAGADTIPQDASIVLGCRPCPEPYSRNRRALTVLKNREGDNPSLTISFEFDPVSFEELPPEDVAEAGEGADFSNME